MARQIETKRLYRVVALVFINSFATIALLALLAMFWRVPLVFPSLGPTAFLLFFSPKTPSACPRNTHR
jgi:CBS-domain-containing membrane protein